MRATPASSKTTAESWVGAAGWAHQCIWRHSGAMRSIEPGIHNPCADESAVAAMILDHMKQRVRWALLARAPALRAITHTGHMGSGLIASRCPGTTAANGAAHSPLHGHSERPSAVIPGRAKCELQLPRGGRRLRHRETAAAGFKRRTTAYWDKRRTTAHRSGLRSRPPRKRKQAGHG